MLSILTLFYIFRYCLLHYEKEKRSFARIRSVGKKRETIGNVDLTLSLALASC